MCRACLVAMYDVQVLFFAFFESEIGGRSAARYGTIGILYVEVHT